MLAADVGWGNSGRMIWKVGVLVGFAGDRLDFQELVAKIFAFEK